MTTRPGPLPRPGSTAEVRFRIGSESLEPPRRQPGCRKVVCRSHPARYSNWARRHRPAPGPREPQPPRQPPQQSRSETLGDAEEASGEARTTVEKAGAAPSLVKVGWRQVPVGEGTWVPASRSSRGEPSGAISTSGRTWLSPNGFQHPPLSPLPARANTPDGPRGILGPSG